MKKQKKQFRTTQITNDEIMPTEQDLFKPKVRIHPKINLMIQARKKMKELLCLQDS